MSEEKGFVPRIAEEPKAADPVQEEVEKVLAEDKKPEPKAVAQIVVTAFDIAPMQVQSTMGREETLMLLKSARQIVAKALAEEK